MELRNTAKKAGVPPELAERLLRLTPEVRAGAWPVLMKAFEDYINPPKFPVRPVPDPETRAQAVAEEASWAAPKRRGVRERSVIISRQEERSKARDYLRVLYTNAEGQMLCQVCQKVMPFKLDDDHYYFEAVEFDRRQSREHPQNHLALCPTCAAKYKHAMGTSLKALRRELKGVGLEIKVVLAQEESTILFVEVHKQDLQALFTSDPTTPPAR